MFENSGTWNLEDTDWAAGFGSTIQSSLASGQFITASAWRGPIRPVPTMAIVILIVDLGMIWL